MVSWGADPGSPGSLRLATKGADPEVPAHCAGQQKGQTRKFRLTAPGNKRGRPGSSGSLRRATKGADPEVPAHCAGLQKGQTPEVPAHCAGLQKGQTPEVPAHCAGLQNEPAFIAGQ
jgi:hypothetical protein